MNAYSYVFRKNVARGRAASRPWRMRRERGISSILEPYLGDVAPPISVRKANFAVWVKRVTDHAKQHRKLSIADIAEMADIGDQTIYRWINREGKGMPNGDQVLAFCDALGIDPYTEGSAFRILWPAKTDKAVEAQPLTGYPEYDDLMKKLQDPNVSTFDKEFIRETLRQLSGRPTTPAKAIKRTGRSGGIKN